MMDRYPPDCITCKYAHVFKSAGGVQCTSEFSSRKVRSRRRDGCAQHRTFSGAQSGSSTTDTLPQPVRKSVWVERQGQRQGVRMNTLEEIDHAIDVIKETGASSRIGIPLTIAKEIVADARRYRALSPIVREAGEALAR